MTSFTRTSPDAACRVFTFKEGVLSALAHDLELEAGGVKVSWDQAASRLEARVDAASLRVLWAVRGGHPDPGALSPDDKRKIEATLAAEVLDARRHPSIDFTSDGVRETPAGFEVRGRLRLAGVERPVTLLVRREGARLQAEVELHQPDFGITPYRAALGALRVKPGVKVRVSVPG